MMQSYMAVPLVLLVATPGLAQQLPVWSLECHTIVTVDLLLDGEFGNVFLDDLNDNMDVILRRDLLAARRVISWGDRDGPDQY